MIWRSTPLRLAIEAENAGLRQDSTATVEMKPLGLNPYNVNGVLIYRLGSLGDTVVALPALHLVARTFPNARRLMLTNFPVHAKAPAASAIIGESGLVHGYISYPVGTRNVLELTRLWCQFAAFIQRFWFI